uniref:Uncharacterized protein n=1 Tax=Arundo donax TaxID=35708 RepID=A0A0A9E4Y6_ARUDO
MQVLMRLIKQQHLWYLKLLQLTSRPLWLAVYTMTCQKDFSQEDNFFRPFHMEKKPFICARSS